jgi:hypothetical protein
VLWFLVISIDNLNGQDLKRFIKVETKQVNKSQSFCDVGVEYSYNPNTEKLDAIGYRTNLRLDLK